MRRLIILIAILLTLNSLCKAQKGKLFLQSYNFLSNNTGIIGYINYPEEQYKMLDTINILDFIINNDTLFTGGKNIYYYNIPTDQKLDSLINVNAKKIRIWKNNLVITSKDHPYFRVYNISNKSLIFSLDSLKTPNTSADMLVSDNKAFILFSKSIQVIDLLAQDTIATLLTPHPYQWAGFNTYLFEINDKLYIDVEYATGATRFSLLEFDKYNFNIRPVFHKEFEANFYKPLPIGDKIYMLGFDSYYDFTSDTLIVNSQYYPVAIEYDKISNSIFLYKPNTLTINYYHDGSYSDSVLIPASIINAIFYNDNANFGDDSDNRTQAFSVFPNPGKGKFTLVFGENQFNKGLLAIYDVMGNKILEERLSESSIQCKEFKEFDLSNFKNGTYLLQINSDNVSLTKKIVLLK